VLSPKRYSVSKPTTVPRHDAILPIGHELMLLVVGCVCLLDKEDIVFFGLKVGCESRIRTCDLKVMSLAS
jgi:hypothetical protein